MDGDMERRVREGAGGDLGASEHASQTRENRMYFGRKEASSPNSALVITLKCLFDCSLAPILTVLSAAQISQVNLHVQITALMSSVCV